MLSLETQEVSKNYFFEIINNKKEKSSKINLSKALMEAEQKKDPKYKTELCKTFSETKQCPYGSKCRFAHGKDELFSKNKGNNYKKKECKSFSEFGFCTYGSRCSFKHDERKLQNINLSFYYKKIFIINNFEPLDHRLDIFIKITSQNNKYNKFSSSSTSEISSDEDNNINKNNINNNINNNFYKENYHYFKNYYPTFSIFE